MNNTITRLVFPARLPAEHGALLVLLRVKLRMARETADDVTRARHCLVKSREWSVVGDYEYCDEYAEIDGKKHGAARWCKLPDISGRGFYKNGLRHGHWWWECQGVLRGMKKYVDGQLHGIEQWWHANGSLDSQFVWKNGKVVT